jgi:hypothetical protein
MVVDAGQAAFAKVRVSPTRRRWTGQPATHPFQVTASRDDGPPLVVDGTMVEQPVLPSWLGKAAALALVLAVLALAGWLALLRPAVRSAAQDAAADSTEAPMAAVRADTAKAQEDAVAAQQAAAQSAGGTSELGKKLVEKGVLKPSDVPKSVVGGKAPLVAAPAAAASAPFSRRLTLATGANGTARTTHTVGDKQVLSLTDLFYENPQGDTGTLTVQVGDRVLFSKGLANFRDLADHFVSPLVLSPGTTLTLRVNCRQPGKTAQANQCSNALVLVGRIAGKPAG